MKIVIDLIISYGNLSLSAQGNSPPKLEIKIMRPMPINGVFIVCANGDEIPNNMVVNGDFVIQANDPVVVSPGLTVNGHMRVDSQVTFTYDLQVSGFLTITVKNNDNDPGVELPDNLTCGSLYFPATTNIPSLKTVNTNNIYMSASSFCINGNTITICQDYDMSLQKFVELGDDYANTLQDWRLYPSNWKKWRVTLQEWASRHMAQ